MMKQTTRRRERNTAHAQNADTPDQKATPGLRREDIQRYVKRGELLGSLLIQGFDRLARSSRSSLAFLKNISRSKGTAIVSQRRQNFADTELSTLSHEDIQRYIERGRRSRAEVLASLLRWGTRGLARYVGKDPSYAGKLGRRLIKAIIQVHQHRVAIRAMKAPDDHGLVTTPPAAVGQTTPKAQNVAAIRHTSEAAANDDKFESAA